MRPAGETRRPFSLSALAEKKIPRSSGAIAPELALHRASEGGYYQKTDSMSLDQLLEWIPAGGPEEALARQVEFDRLPRHVAIIMDGNGRWAGERRLPRVEGHRAGVDAVRDVVESAARRSMPSPSKTGNVRPPK
jgi:hypothetical protein